MISYNDAKKITSELMKTQVVLIEKKIDYEIKSVESLDSIQVNFAQWFPLKVTKIIVDKYRIGGWDVKHSRESWTNERVSIFVLTPLQVTSHH